MCNLCIYILQEIYKILQIFTVLKICANIGIKIFVLIHAQNFTQYITAD